MPYTTHDKPLAVAGLTSYRCRCPSGFGWIMLGATDHEDAMREARRSNEAAKREDLEIWNGREYTKASA